MTSEQFHRDYQLLDRVTEGAAETYHAQATSGAMVMVHYLRGSEEDNAEIYGLIERLNAERKRKVLISADVDGVPAIITRFILDFRTLREWLGAPSAAAPSENATPAKAPPPRSAAGEFTMMFGSPVDADKADPPAVQAPAPPPPEPVAPPPPKSGPGEFTRMFASGSDAPAPVSPPPAAPPPPQKEPGEFTRMFGQSAPQQPAAAAPPPPAKEPGEFTRLFGGPDPQGGAPPAPSAPTVPSAPPPPPPARGEFTAMFGASSRPSDEAPRAPEPPLTPASPPPPPIFSAPPVNELSFGAPPAPSTPTGGSYSRMFGVPAPQDPHDQLFPNQPAPSADAGAGHDQYFERLTKGLPPSSAPPPSPSAPPPPMYTGQSEFTRVVSALPAPPVASPPPPPIAPAPAPARSNRILLFGLVGVVLTAIIFVVLLIAIG